jgi:hypothetical protein
VRLPNCFIAGAPKAGTDQLFYQLEQHPQIQMSPLKEPNYFAEEIRPENFHPSLREHVERNVVSTRDYLDAGAREKRFGGMVTTLDDYGRLFANGGEQRVVAEGSVCYLWSRTAAGRIADLIPSARVILILMDPAERAFRQYLKSLADGNVTHSFTRHLDLGFEDVQGSPTQIRLFNPFLAFGEYADQVERYLKRFPREQIFVSLYEDTQVDWEGWFAGLLRFLGVDPEFRPAAVEVPSTPRFSSDLPQPCLLPEERARLVDYYRAGILRLESLIGRNLSAWLE